MDTLTHALSGALVARASARHDAPRGATVRRVTAGFLACAAPDLDFVLGILGPAAYLEHHRGATHSLILLPLWALLLSWLLAKVLREPGGWRALYGICALVLGAHIAGDVITSFGTVMLAPFSDWRAALGTTFIIDLVFTGIIVGGLVASLLFRRTRWPAVAASLVLVGYVGFQYLQKQKALAFGEQYARAQGLEDAVVSAQPRPVSAFNWTVFVSDEREHRFAHVDVARREPRRLGPDAGFLARLDEPYLPLEKAVWETRSRFGDPSVAALVREAWNSPPLGFFRWFAALPAFDGMSGGSTCVWFSDLRFLTPGREGMPFLFGACRETPEGEWSAYQRTGESSRRPVR